MNLIARSSIALLSCSIAISCSSAYAEEPKSTSEPPKTVYAKKTVLDFSAVQLTGDVIRPMESFVIVPKKARFRCMVRTRDNFRSEIEASAESL